MGQGFCLVDPHGDLAEQVRGAAGDHAMYWDVADPACPYGYNPLTYVKAEYRPLIASGIIETLKQQWADAWGARMVPIPEYPATCSGNIRPLIPGHPVTFVTAPLGGFVDVSGLSFGQARWQPSR